MSCNVFVYLQERLISELCLCNVFVYLQERLISELCNVFVYLQERLISELRLNLTDVETSLE